ncbi:MAG TPA: type II toxin-antitoxin system RelE/ParE family toxin [Hanamia sp.]
MVKKIIWSKKADADRRNIFSYWNQRNQSNHYSIKLNKLFKEVLKLVSEHPKIGKLTDIENVRIKIVRDYLIVYEELEDEILTLTIFSSHQDTHSGLYNPESLP